MSLHEASVDSYSSIGLQKNSLRPSSARYSIPRAPRKYLDEPEVSPGPIYDCRTVKEEGRSTVIGTGPQITYLKPYPYQDMTDSPDAKIPDNAELRFRAAPRATFGYEERAGKVLRGDLARVSPEHSLGVESPGFVYNPDDRKVRPRSAPSYTMRGRGGPEAGNSRGGGASSRTATPSKVAPNSYRHEAALGKQIDSRRKTARSSSFSRAERFPAPKQSTGDLTAECVSVDSSFGRQRVAGRNSAPSAAFGYATRAGEARRPPVCIAADRPASARMGPPRMPHPPLSSRQEQIVHACQSRIVMPRPCSAKAC
eukprot:gnl/TRDRNA2_/TRDRNA2_73853_c0_seq1.p1 gnl/TRDRNA2_/TRDRNA2_73853_c0~~gnl/TRDRNA2_/TRDRNA2_73853_c0_seq1.p1  ORF type:complete len:312 (+),score=21.89 gnl/TRDRNA2_/TRDRNA2_73853_c0_seq1:85-1020(+)